MRSEKVKFKNEEGEELSGIIDFPPTGNPRVFAVFAHCFTCSKNFKAVHNVSNALVQNGIAVLRFDFTGLGESDGEFEDTNFSSNLSDLKQAYRYLEDNYRAPQIMIGHSLGGAAVLHVSAELEAVNAVVTIAAPADPKHVKKLLKQTEKETEDRGEVMVEVGGKPFTVKKQFIKDLSSRDPEKVIHELGKALLIVHSPQDTIVDIDNAAEIYDHAMHPKSFVTLDGADHLMSEEADSYYVGNIIMPWASRYLKDEVEPSVAPEGEVWTRISDRGFLTEITAGRHQLIADEPKDSGGTDFGPSPYGYLLAALGTCTAMTLRMYADHKKIELKEVKVKLTHDKIHGKDGDQAESDKGKIDQIKRFVTLEGNLSDDQRKRLIEIADRCPVHKTLEGRPQIVTEETDEI